MNTGGGVPSSSWLNVGRSFQAGLSLVPSSSQVSNEPLLKLADEGYSAEKASVHSSSSKSHYKRESEVNKGNESSSSSSSFSEDSSSSSEESLDSRSAQNKEKKAKKKKKHSSKHREVACESKDKDDDRNRHSRKKKDRKDKKKKSHKDKKRDHDKEHKHRKRSREHDYDESGAKEGQLIPVPSANQAIIEMKDDFETSTEEEYEEDKSKETSRGMLVVAAPTAKRTRTGLEEVSWRIDNSADYDIPLFLDFKYYPMPSDKSAEQVDVNNVRSGVVLPSKESASIAGSKTDRLFQQQPSKIMTLSSYLQSKRRQQEANMSRDERYFARKHRKALLDPMSTKLVLQVKKQQQGGGTSGAIGIIPLPVLSIEELLQEAQNTESVSIKSDSQLASAHVMEQTKQFNIAMRISEESNDDQGQCMSVVPHLQYAALQLELYQRQQIASGKAEGNVLQSISLIPKDIPTSVRERQVDITQQAMDKLIAANKLQPPLSTLQQRLLACEISMLTQSLLHYKQSMMTTQQVIEFWYYSLRTFPQVYAFFEKSLQSSSSQFAFSSHKQFKEDFVTTLKLLQTHASKEHQSTSNATTTEKKRVSRFASLDQPPAQVNNEVNFDFESCYASLELVFCQYLWREKAMDHWEQVIAYIQAMLLYASPQLRLMHGAGNIQEEVSKLEQYWEAEWIRPGEIMEPSSNDGTLPPKVQLWRDDFQSVQQLPLMEKCIPLDRLLPSALPNLMAEVVQAKQPEGESQPTAKDEQSADNSNAEGGEWVYSRVHGYKIFIKHTEDHKLYKHILEDLGKITDGKDGEEHEDGNLESDKNRTSQTRADAFTWQEVDWYNDPYILGYFQNYCCQHVQYYPLRGLHPVHVGIVERQPERLIFFQDDILPILAPLPPLPLTEVEINVDTVVEYIIFYTRLVDHSLLQLGLQSVTNGSTLNLYDADLNVTILPALNNFNQHSYADDWSRISGTFLNATYSYYPPKEQSTMTMYVEGISLHPNAVQEIRAIGVDQLTMPRSKASMMLSLIESVMAELVAMRSQSNSHPKLQSVIRQALSRLRSLHMVLQCLICYHLLAALRQSNGEDAEITTNRNQKLIAQHRENSKTWLEMTVATEHMHLQDKTVSVVGDLCNWATYLQCDLIYHFLEHSGNMTAIETNITKMIDKVLSSLSSHHQHYDMLLGHREFFQSILSLLLSLTSVKNDESSRALEKTLTHVLLHYFSRLSSFSTDELSDWRQYQNWLKSSTKDSKRSQKFQKKVSSQNEASSPTLSNGIFAHVLQTLQSEILRECSRICTSLPQPQQFADVKQTSTSEKFVGLAGSDMTSSTVLEVFYHINQLAWLTYLSYRTTSTSQERESVEDWKTIIDAVHDVYQRSIDLLLQLLVSSIQPEGQKNANQETIPSKLLEDLLRSGFHDSLFTSAAQRRLLLTIKRLYIEQMHFYIYVSRLVQLQGGYQVFQELIFQPMVSMVKDALLIAPQDTHLHQYLMHLNMSPVLSRRGYILMKSFYRQQASAWYISSCPERLRASKLFELQMELQHIAQRESQSQLHWSVSAATSPTQETSSSDLVEYLLPDWKLFLSILRCETWSEDSYLRLYYLFESIVALDACQSVPLFWRMYLYISLSHYYTHHHQGQMRLNQPVHSKKAAGSSSINRSLAHCKKIVLRAIHHCGYCKLLYMDVFCPQLRPAFSDEELAEMTQLMETQGIYFRS